ncbi:MAG: hypothetical protein U0821_05065 [Chloroflexota bacterium]
MSSNPTPRPPLGAAATPAAAPMNCPKCGEPVTAELRFCESCGQALAGSAPPTVDASGWPKAVLWLIGVLWLLIIIGGLYWIFGQAWLFS